MSQDKRKRILMTLTGVLLGGFSVGLFNQSDFGMDPFQVMAHGVWTLTPLSFGTFYMLLNAVLLVAMFFMNRKKIGVTTFINLFLLGYVVQFSSDFLASLWPEPGLAARILMLAAGFVLLCFSSSLYYVGDLGVSTYDVIAITLGERTTVPFHYWRILTDVICTAIGFLLGQTLGVGTVLTAFFMGPLIAWFRDRAAMPFRYGPKAAALLQDRTAQGSADEIVQVSDTSIRP